MRKLSTNLAQKLKSELARLGQMRRGSVLIIVVALLVMMALIGAAAITMARLDRYAARQQVTTVENEIIREAMLQRARSDALNALSRDNTGTIDSPNIYQNVRIDPYLASRFPVTYTGVAAPAGLDPFVCYYPALSKATPAVSTAQFASGYKPFEDILTQQYYSDMYPDDPSAGGRLMQTWIPGSVTIQYSATYPEQIMQGKTRVFPAFHGVYNLLGTGTYLAVLAGDADGDGVADCGMYRITDTPLRGEHFYVGIKIVDNNAVINPQIAWSREHDYDAGTGTLLNYGFFGGNVGFGELLATQDHDYTAESGVNNPVDNLTNYNNYRFGVGTTNKGADVNPVRVADTINPAPVIATDYNYDSQGEAKNSGLDRRLKAPSYNGSASFSFQALPVGDSTAFAYKNNFVNPTGSQGQLAQFLPYSFLYSAPNYTLDTAKAWRYYPANPMDPGNTFNVWWNELDFSTGGKTKASDGKPRSIRQLIATLNPTIDVSRTKQIAMFDWNGDGGADAKDPPYPGMLPWTLTNAGTWATGSTYQINNIVKDNDTGAPYFSFIAVDGQTDAAFRWDPATSANTAQEPFAGGNLAAAPTFWEYQPYITGNAPTSANTATFRELWRSYYNVMAEDNNATPFDTAFSDAVKGSEGGTVPADWFNPTTATDYYNPFLGREFDPMDTTYYGPKHVANQASFPYEENPSRMFGNVIRDIRFGKQDLGATGTFLWSQANKPMRLNPNQVMALRSALSAINLVGMRDQGFRPSLGSGSVVLNNVYSRTITLYDTPTTTATPPPSPAPLPRFQATVFSGARQPFITEVLAYHHRDNPGTNMPRGYIAIELHNPYPIPLDIGGWQVASLDRRNPYQTLQVPTARYPATDTPGTGVPAAEATDTYTNMVYRALTAPATGLAGIPPATKIPANGYVVLENYSNTAGDPLRASIARPPLAEAKMATVPPTQIIYIANLHEVMPDSLSGTDTPPVTGSEFVLLRPRRGDGVPSKSEDWYGAGHVPAYDVFDEGVAGALKLSDWVPVDSFDFTGFDTEGTRLHYIRASRDALNALTNAAQWKCVYPGRYNGNEWAIRHQGTESVVAAVDFATPAETPAPVKPITLGNGDLLSSWEQDPAGPPNPDPNFPAVTNFTVPLCEIDWPGYNTLYNVTTSQMEAIPFKWPYGGFARTGDLLKVPYIGAYTIREVEKTTTAGKVPLGSTDRGTLLAKRFPAATHADATPITADEYILESNPITIDAMFAEDTAAGSNAIEDLGRFCPKDGTYYTWANDLLNYFTVTHNYADDYMPNINPVYYFRMTGVYPQRVGNDGAKPENANEGNEDNVAANGLINVNTAPAEVLDMLPMVVDPTGKVLEPDNRHLADAIVAHRSDPTKGPFQSLFDLNKVVDPADPNKGFQNAMGQMDLITLGGTDPGDSQGDFSPYDSPKTGRTGVPQNDFARNDFEERYLQVARLSNLLTVRSDSFNVYVLVQSWKHIGEGTATPPMLTWEKRIAFTADRSTVDATTQARIIKTTDIPAD